MRAGARRGVVPPPAWPDYWGGSRLPCKLVRQAACSDDLTNAHSRDDFLVAAATAAVATAAA